MVLKIDDKFQIYFENSQHHVDKLYIKSKCIEFNKKFRTSVEQSLLIAIKF